MKVKKLISKILNFQINKKYINIYKINLIRFEQNYQYNKIDNYELE